METLFPSFFTFSYFAPLILRLAIALVFFEAARSTWKTPGTGARVASLSSAALGALLFIGLFTQLAALLGIAKILALTYQKKVPSIFHSKTFALLAIAILISLMLTGAGGLAVDLPY
jgi:uncharacterized membrane protein YphA (DoxX/SURF4 family)